MNYIVTTYRVDRINRRVSCSSRSMSALDLYNSGTLLYNELRELWATATIAELFGLIEQFQLPDQFSFSTPIHYAQAS